MGASDNFLVLGRALLHRASAGASQDAVTLVLVIMVSVTLVSVILVPVFLV